MKTSKIDEQMCISICNDDHIKTNSSQIAWNICCDYLALFFESNETLKNYLIHTDETYMNL